MTKPSWYDILDLRYYMILDKLRFKTPLPIIHYICM